MGWREMVAKEEPKVMPEMTTIYDAQTQSIQLILWSDYVGKGYQVKKWDKICDLRSRVFSTLRRTDGRTQHLHGERLRLCTCTMHMPPPQILFPQSRLVLCNNRYHSTNQKLRIFTVEVVASKSSHREVIIWRYEKKLFLIIPNLIV